MTLVVADTKKCQTLINAAGRTVPKLKEIATLLEDLRIKFNAAGVNPADTPLEGHVAQVSAWINLVRTVADNPIANGLVAAIVESHRGEAL